MNPFLSALSNASDKALVSDTNFDKIARSLAYLLTPSLEGDGSPTTDLGPPTAGDHVQDELWVDAATAMWRCTAPGTPGDWIQVQPAVMNTADLPVAPPDLYLVMVADGPWTLQYWNDGGSAWVPV